MLLRNPLAVKLHIIHLQAMLTGRHHLARGKFQLKDPIKLRQGLLYRHFKIVDPPASHLKRAHRNIHHIAGIGRTHNQLVNLMR